MLSHVVSAQVLRYTNAEFEPQFLADDRTPFHDESFPFRRRSNTHVSAGDLARSARSCTPRRRLQLGNELCRAGFRFALVADCFSVHPGVKTNETRAERTAKAAAVRAGYVKVSSQEERPSEAQSRLQQVRSFVERLNRQYPKTKKLCPAFKP